MTTLTLDLPADASAPRAARTAVAETVEGRRLDELLLCVSEVVTNAVLHARSAVSMVLTRTGDNVRVEVHDDDPTMPVRRNPAPETPTGRGLLLLDRLTARWGASPSARGKVVWFDFDMEAAA